MDSAAESDGDAASKRPRTEMEMDGGDGVRKRRRGNGEEMEMKRVAEIVLVLSAMGRMRGGKDPTAVEKAMMAEAKEKVVALCEQLAPKDILPRESFGVVIDDLGLNRLKEQRLGFRTPKLSISDKMALTIRRMEESKTFVAQPALYPSQSLQNTGVAGENRVLPPNVRMFSSGKAGHMPVSSQSTPAVHVSSASSTPPSFRPPGTAAPAAAVSSSMPNNIARDSPQMVTPRVDRAHLRPDGRLNGPSFVTQVPAAVSSSADQRVVRNTHVSLQPQSGPLGNMGMQKKVPDHLPGKSDGNTNLSAPQMTAQAAAGQIPKSVVSQTAPGSKPTVQHHNPMQGMHFAHTSPVFSHHLEISKVVQKVLDPKLSERPVWTPPSRDYMNRAVLCQFCKVVINGVENVLVCDACEKGFHVGCLQSYNAKGIPRGEWHCPRCLAMNHGKPFPPKYGRVTRNMNASKGSSSTAGFQLSSDKKREAADSKVSKPDTITNGKSDFKTQAPDLKVAESSSESSLQHGNMINQKDMCAVTKKDEAPNSVKSPIDANGTLVETSLATSTGSSSDKPYQKAVKSEISEDTTIPKIESRIPFLSRTMNTSDALPTSSNHNNVDQERLSNGAEASLYQHYDCNGVVECNKNCDGERHEKDASKETPLEKEKAHDQYGELVEGSESSLRKVSWIGDTARVVDEKKYFQSCCINGVAYKVQDYALFRSSNGNLTPLKIQGMWEDTQTSLKWLIVHRCYFPDDLPKEVGRPGAPQGNEVYESTRDSNVRATTIEGPCEVLPFRKFGEETERSIEGSQTNDRTGPIFVRNWFYDESKRAFCPSAS